MGFITLFLTGVSLSMDAFAVSICRGLQMRARVNIKHLLIIAAFFGGFQALMPAIGYLLGSQFKDYIVSVDHWLAFGLLAVIGGKMIWDVIAESREGEEDCPCCGDAQESLDVRQIALMAVATSIDALAVGITFAFLEVNLLLAVAVIGITTFALCALGVVVGHKFGARFKNKATLAGGIALILIGTKILLEHLGILAL